MRKISKIMGFVLAVAMIVSCINVPLSFAADEKKLEDYPEELVLLDVNSEKDIIASGLIADTKTTNEKQFSAKWKLSDKGSVTFKGVTDIGGYGTIEAYIYAEKGQTAKIKVYIDAENPKSSGMDYYDGGTFVVKEGWNKYSFSISDMAESRVREPLLLSSIEGITFNASGWGLSSSNDMENTAIYFDSIVLKRGTRILKGDGTDKILVEDEEISEPKKYIEVDFETDKIENVGGLFLAKKSNKIELVRESGKENSYVTIEKLADGKDCHIDINFEDTGRYFVIQGDFMSTKFADINVIVARDADKKQCNFLNLKANGEITAVNKTVGKLKLGKWTNIAICTDVMNRTFDFYIDGKLVLEDASFESKMNNIVFTRTIMGSDCESGSNICMDNIRMYDGKTPADYAKVADLEPVVSSKSATGTDGKIDVNTDVKPNIVTVENNAVADVSDAVCLKVNCPTALVYHEQKYIDENNKSVVPMIVNSRTLVPVRFISESFGAEVGWDDATKTVTVKKDSDVLELVIGSNIIKKNGEEITIDVPAEIYFDRTMLPLRAVTENLGKKVFWDDMGLIIISDKEFNYNKKDDLATMIDIMQSFIYERPSRETLKADIEKTTPNHPRIYATASDFDRMRNYYKTDAEFKSWVDAISVQADKYVATAMNNSEAKPFVYAYNSGGRLEDKSNIPEKAPALALMYQMTGDKKYVDTMWYTLEDVCDREKWSNWGVGHFIDAAEIMEAVAIAYDWMYDAWTDEQRAIIEEALYDCGVEDGLTSYYGASDFLQPPMGVGNRSEWTKWDSNWNPGSNIGVVAASVAMMTHEKYGNLAAKALELATRSLEIGLRCYAPDGGHPEGPGYWDFGTGSAAKIMNILQVACGAKRAYGLADSAGFESTWRMPVFMESKVGSFNYGDNLADRGETRLLMWFGNTYNRNDVSALRYNELRTGEKPSRIWDVLWYRADKIAGAAELPLDTTFFKIGSATMRSSWTDQNQLFAGIHGGLGKVGHADVDSGTFVFDAEGERWFMDLGSDYYNLPSYFHIYTGAGRWKYYAKRAEGQNLFVINPTALEEQDIMAISYITEMQSKPRGAFAKIDLTDAYAKEVTKAERGIMLAANRKAFVVQDEIAMKKPSEFHWFAHTQAEIELAEDGKSAILSQRGKKLFVQLMCDNADLKFEIMGPVGLPTSPAKHEKEVSRAGIRKLAIHGKDIENIKLAMVCTPMYNNEKLEYSYDFSDLADWNIPDGENFIPRLESISVGGENIKNFEKEKTAYEVVMPYGTTEFPEISAVADSFSNYEVKVKPETLPGTAVIKVENKDDKAMYTSYSIFVRAASDVELEPSGAQEGNPGENALDGDFATRWAVQGESWGIFRFANPKTISSVWVAAWRAESRKLIFDIEVSEDGENFKQVWSGQSTSDKEELEEFKIPEGTYKAVKFVLHGTTAGAWNSILEVEFK